MAGAPPAKGIMLTRIAEGNFLDIGEGFKRVDTWTARSSAHADLGRRWTGTTRFLLRAGFGSNSEEGQDEPQVGLAANTAEGPAKNKGIEDAMRTAKSCKPKALLKQCPHGRLRMQWHIADHRYLVTSRTLFFGDIIFGILEWVLGRRLDV